MATLAPEFPRSTLGSARRKFSRRDCALEPRRAVRLAAYLFDTTTPAIVALASADARALEDQLVLRWHGDRHLDEGLNKTPPFSGVFFDHRTVTLGLHTQHL